MMSDEPAAATPSVQANTGTADPSALSHELPLGAPGLPPFARRLEISASRKPTADGRQGAPLSQAQRIEALPVSSEQDDRRLLFEFNDTAAPWNPDDLIHRQFERAVDAHPDAVALVFEDQALSFRDLDERANRLAHVLVERGVRPDARVGLCMHRGPDLVVGLLAVLKAGGGYVPLDPAFPAERLAYVLQDAAAQVLLSSAELASKLGGGQDAVLIDREAERIAAQPATRLRHPERPDQLAYVIYTSGSTGRPKGVMIEHRNVTSFFVGMERLIGLDSHGTWLAGTTVAFDISVLEILGSLTHGRRLVLLGDTILGQVRDPKYGIPASVRRHQVTHFQCTPTQCRMLLIDGEARAALGSLEQLIVGGEALAPDLADELLQLGLGQLVNLYGPTETTVWSTGTTILPGDRVTIGRPIANAHVYILDGAGQLLPEGAVGELYIGGPGVTRGYLGQPGLTAERFIENRLRPDLGGRLYRTGDLARWCPDGTVAYIGRNDHQVKVRGFRIELGEIETAIRRVRGVGDVAVVAKGQGADQRLVAYLVANEPYAGDDVLRATLRTHLPDYMVPSSIVRLPALPLTPNGKLDRKALPEPTAGPVETAAPYTPPANDLEQTLCNLWQEALGLARVGVEDDFFELGGHSLMAVRIFDEIHKKYGVRLALAVLFESSTVRTLAARIRAAAAPSAGAVAEWTTVVPVRRDGALPPLFCVAGLGGNPLNLRHFAAALGDDQPFYGLQHRGADGKLEPHRTIRAMAEEFLRDLRTVQTHGPYFLAGYSSGGLAAYEAARLLLEAGETVGLVVLLDTSNPEILNWPVRERIAAHIANLRKIGPRYLSIRGMAFAQRTRLELEKAIQRIRRVGQPDAPLAHFEQRYDRLVDATIEAEKGYAPQEIDADVLVIQADAAVPPEGGIGYPHHESNGWRGKVRGLLGVEQIPCSHLNLVNEEVAPATGAVVAARLAKARQRVAKRVSSDESGPASYLRTVGAASPTAAPANRQGHRH